MRSLVVEVFAWWTGMMEVRLELHLVIYRYLCISMRTSDLWWIDNLSRSQHDTIYVTKFHHSMNAFCHHNLLRPIGSHHVENKREMPYRGRIDLTCSLTATSEPCCLSQWNPTILDNLGLRVKMLTENFLPTHRWRKKKSKYLIKNTCRRLHRDQSAHSRPAGTSPGYPTVRGLQWDRVTSAHQLAVAFS